MLLEIEYFQWEKQEKILKILTPKKMLQKLPIALAQVKVYLKCSISEILLNEIRQIIYFLYRARGIIKKVYNIMNLLNL